jgi:exodeoxyribonuclease V beta subunit
MAKFDILSKETPVLGRRFLEASAGTGKTFTIEHLFVRLVEEEKIPLEQVLVVTFTRAATRELKQRIRAKLGQRADLDTLQIYTIHGFCQQMLREFAFEAKSPIETLEWTPEEEEEAFLQFLEGPDLSPLVVERLVRKYRRDLRAVKTAVSSSSLTSKSLTQIAKEVSHILQEFSPDSVTPEFERIRGDYRGMGKDEFLAQSRHLDTALQRRECCVHDLIELTEHKPFFLSGLSDAHRKVRASGPLPSLTLQALTARLSPLLTAAATPEALVEELGILWRDLRARHVHAEEKRGPDEIVKAMEAGLSHPRFIEKVRSRYRAVMIDEFQDTDPVQWKIFHTLFWHGEMAALYLVGDPKQSIYAFRGADLYTYLEAHRQFQPSEVFHLDTNFRSEKQLVTAFNQLFSATPWLRLPEKGICLEVPPSQAAKEGDKGAIQFFIAEGKIGRKQQWPSSDIEEEMLFPFIVHEMERLALPPQDVAILVKDRFQGRRVQKFLERWNIPVSLRRSTDFTETTILPFLEEAVAAAIDPKRKAAAVLMGPLFGGALDDTHPERRFLFEAKWPRLYALLEERGFSAFSAALLHEEWRGHTPFERLNRSNDASLYRGWMGVLPFLHGLKGALAIRERLAELRGSPFEGWREGSFRGVQILTIHASKGLEFRHVFALGLASRSPVRELAKAEERDAEKLRQLYVAMTRAKERLYVPVVRELEGREIDVGEASPIELFLTATGIDPRAFPHTELRQFRPILIPRSDEEKSLTSPLALPPCPAPERIVSFSSLARKSDAPMAAAIGGGDIPAGAETGVILHTIFEKIFGDPTAIETTLRGTPLENYLGPITKLVEATLAHPLLHGICSDKVLTELEFAYPRGNDLVKGFIDLLFERDGKYYLVDWKSHALPGYTESHLERAMREGDYFLQASLYVEALRRFVRLFDSRPFSAWFGGVLYVFVRGPAVYTLLPEVFDE